MIRVGVVGATGKMGREVCRAVHADPDLALVGAISRSASGRALSDVLGLEGSEVVASDVVESLLEVHTEVMVDFSGPAYAAEHIAWGIGQGVHVVEGSTGFDVDPAWGAQDRVGVVVAPNFAIGAVLAMRFAEQAARFLPDAEVIELHHPGKLDAPSGTAIATARRIAESRAAGGARPPAGAADGDGANAPSRGADVDGVRVHSVRLPGLVAHEEIVFGGQGQTLSIRHDSTDRSSFMPGVLLAIKAVGGHPGLTIGLDPLLVGA
jgi:4-hydroxy-tetrahydrodipicolinate reductase